LIVLPDLASGSIGSRALSDMPDVHYNFIRTDDVPRLGGLPNDTRQGIVVQVDSARQRILVADPDSGANAWVDVGATPGVMTAVRLGVNVYLIDEAATAGRAATTRVVPQSAGLHF
jgi:hypothetical protein